MGIKYPLKSGYYEVTYEDDNSEAKRVVELQLNEIQYEEDLLEFMVENVPNFYTLKGKNPVKFLRGDRHPNRQVAIVPITNEYEINELLDNGYTIREFHEGNCILQNRKRTI